MSSPENAFQELAQVFLNRHNHIFEIEILPQGLGPLLQDGCSIGLTKKFLVQAFVVARKIFLSNSGNDALINDPHDEDVRSQVDDISVSTEIILLFDPEHLTACNWRRRRLAALIKSLEMSNTQQTHREELIQILESEITLLTTYLCSPLHRHTKSPTLWQHRFWALTQLARIRGQSSKPQSPIIQQYDQTIQNQNHTQELFSSELATVLRAGELHPKNYYAFSYMRQLHHPLSRNLDKTGDGSELLAQSVIHQTVDWCLVHPRDISGWMFVTYLLEAIPHGNTRADTVDRVVRFALDIGWEGESLWTFVDLAVRAFGLGDFVQELMRSATGVIPTTPVPLAGLLDGRAPLEKPWETWLAQARAYWSANSSSSKEDNDRKKG